MNYNKLKELVDQGLSTHGIAKKIGCGQTNVRYWLRKHGLNTKVQELDSSDLPNGNLCCVCHSTLYHRKIKYCSAECRKSQANGNTVDRQRSVARQRKVDLINLAGGKCEKCGYSKNLAALSFHHENPKNKTFTLDSRRLSNTNWESILLEFKKCKLLCLNCHAELHNPDLEWN